MILYKDDNAQRVIMLHVVEKTADEGYHNIVVKFISGTTSTDWWKSSEGRSFRYNVGAAGLRLFVHVLRVHKGDIVEAIAYNSGQQLEAISKGGISKCFGTNWDMSKSAHAECADLNINFVFGEDISKDEIKKSRARKALGL